VRDEIRDCPVCSERTAHQTRGVAWPLVAGPPLAVAGVLLSAIGFPFALPWSAPLAGLGVWLVVHDRQQRRDIACGRCRAKAVALRRFSVARTSTVDVL